MLSRPFYCGTCCDSQVKDPPTIVRQRHKHIKDLKPDGRHRQEVYRYQALDVVLNETRPVWEGGFRLRTRYLLTLVSPILMPSLSNSPSMRGAPQPGFFLLMRRIKSRTVGGKAGRAGLPLRIFPVEKIANALCCHATMLSGSR